MSGHTSGPWTIEYPMGDERSIIVGGGPNNDDIAEFFFKDTSTVSIAYDEAVANARLFLNAREVAESLKDMLRIIEAVRYTVGLGKGQMGRVEKAKAALAKAGV